MAARNQLTACVIRQYGTGLYQAWVRLDKGHTVCLGTHQDEVAATETLDRFLETYQEGQIKTREELQALINSICVKDLMAPLPQIGQSVGEMAA